MTGAVDRACQAHGLATVTGRVSTTGIAGFTLGGGSGMLERRFGFAVDNLLAVELVTADGELITADPRPHSDLFWALRGGGGNYGVVTSLTFRAPSYRAGRHRRADAARRRERQELLRHLRAVMETAPEHLAVFMFYMYGPDDASIPEDCETNWLRPDGQPTPALLARAEPDLAPLRSFGPPAVDFVEETTWADLQCSIDDPPGYPQLHDFRSPGRSHRRRDRGDRPPRPTAAPRAGLGGVFCWGGAVSRPPSPTPLNRDARWVVHPGAFWEDALDDVRVHEWVGQLRGDLQPHTTGALWLNWIGDEGSARVRVGLRRGVARTAVCGQGGLRPRERVSLEPQHRAEFSTRRARTVLSHRIDGHPVSRLRHQIDEGVDRDMAAESRIDDTRSLAGVVRRMRVDDDCYGRRSGGEPGDRTCGRELRLQRGCCQDQFGR